MNTERFRRLQEIFQAAVEKKPEERAAYADEACGNDPELRTELLALLAAHRKDDTFLEESILHTPDPGPDSEPLENGQLVGAYRVDHEIGRGGMGVVYLAEDTRLHRKVALKALSENLLTDPRQQERFRREARAAASLSHPGIATVYALEEVEDHFYLVSEYVPGNTLRSEMGHSEIERPLKAVIETGLQVAEGLAAAHAKGIVHRDLKPENIVRTDQGQLKIVDFGVALVQSPDSTSQRLTQGSVVVGTPAYMSPEQLRGEAVDFRSDLFSFGILLHELAVGAHPFQGKTALHTTAKILENEPKGLDELSEAAPGLGQLIGRCLRKTPQERHGSTSQLVGELQKLRSEYSRNAVPQIRPAPAGRGSERDAPRALSSHWWTFHQAAVLLFYAVMIFVLAWNTSAQVRPLSTLASVYLFALGAMANGAFRSHLLFTARFNPSAIADELLRTHSWRRALDGLLVATLLIAAVTIVGADRLMAGVFAGVAAAYAVVFLVVEPSTVRSVFPARNPSEG